MSAALLLELAQLKAKLAALQSPEPPAYQWAMTVAFDGVTYVAHYGEDEDGDAVVHAVYIGGQKVAPILRDCVLSEIDKRVLARNAYLSAIDADEVAVSNFCSRTGRDVWA